jgi:hypothetical protein
MDSNASNYDPSATMDDWSCTYPVYWCTDPSANNYDPIANEDDWSCTYDTYWCMVEYATNYNPSANQDDSSCTYDYLILPSESDDINNALTNNWQYNINNWDFEWSGAISLERTNTMPADINLKN